MGSQRVRQDWATSDKVQHAKSTHSSWSNTPHKNVSLSSVGTDSHPGRGWKDDADLLDCNQVKLGFCQPLLQSYAEFSSISNPHPHHHEYASLLRLERPQFCSSGSYCFGKDIWCFPYLIQVTNPSPTVGSTPTKRQIQLSNNNSTCQNESQRFYLDHF